MEERMIPQTVEVSSNEGTTPKRTLQQVLCRVHE